jgi:hypothetical protein
MFAWHLRKKVVTIFACHLRLCQQPTAVHALRSDQFLNFHSPHLFTPSGRKVSRLLCSACTTQLQCTHFARTDKKSYECYFPSCIIFVISNQHYAISCPKKAEHPGPIYGLKAFNEIMRGCNYIIFTELNLVITFLTRNPD